MNRREAKREACFRVAMVADNALSEGWLAEHYPDEGDEWAVAGAVQEVIDELTRRGGREAR